MIDDYIDDIKSSIKKTDQLSIFSNKNRYIDIENSCCRFLRFLGYSIYSPKEFSMDIKSINDLVAYFYVLYNKKNKGGIVTSYNEAKDRSIASRFVNERMTTTGASREYTLSECGEIIKTIFEYEEEFNFKYDISFSILGNAKSKWITDKAIQIMNEKIRKEKEFEEEEIRIKAVDSYDTSDLGFKNLDEILDKMGE